MIMLLYWTLWVSNLSMYCPLLLTLETFIVNYHSFLYHNTLQTCQASVPCIPHQMKKHTILPDGITVIHVRIEKPAHHRVPHIGIYLQGMVHHTLTQGGKEIEADHSLEQGEIGMEVGHFLIQRKQWGGGRGDLIQGIFTQTKSITNCEHDHIHKPEAVTITCTLESIHQILCRPTITQDHGPNCHYVHGRKTVTNILTLPQKNHVRLNYPYCHPIHEGEKLTDVDTLPQKNNVRHHNPNRNCSWQRKNSQM